MSNLKVVGWTIFEDKYPTRKAVGDDFRDMINAILDEIREKGYVFGGEDHQNFIAGVPVFSDGTCFRASMRSWGNIMSMVYSGPNGEKLTYMDFYMSLGDSAVLPDYGYIPVKPATFVGETSIGCTTKEDKRIVEEAIALGMPFITTDKVLQALYEREK